MSKRMIGEPHLHRFEIGLMFRKFDQLIRFKGTHLMQKEIQLLHKLTFEAAAKSYTDTGLTEIQELFTNKISELRWVNGYNDVSDEDFNEIYTEWTYLVMDLVDDWLENDLYDYDRYTETMDVNIGRITDSFVNVEVIRYKKDTGG